ncbi:MAG TPA: lytic transglycosylase, partial [Syntrophaceae bacterium]|nr:lytic transglycosylase [Syntrophaceae bacterium]
GYARADIYEYVDKNGVHHFTNVPTDSRYRLIIKGRVRVDREFSDFDPIIYRVSKRYRLDSHLVRAIIKAESDFDPQAVSYKGALGLMQLMPYTARDLRIFNPLDPQQNIMGGIRYLKQLLARFDGNIPLALAAYNAGPDQVNRYNGIPPFEETRRFVDRVLKFYRQYKTNIEQF